MNAAPMSTMKDTKNRYVCYLFLTKNDVLQWFIDAAKGIEENDWYLTSRLILAYMGIVELRFQDEGRKETCDSNVLNGQCSRCEGSDLLQKEERPFHLTSYDDQIQNLRLCQLSGRSAIYLLLICPPYIHPSSNHLTFINPLYLKVIRRWAEE